MAFFLPPLTLFAFFISAALSGVAAVVMNSVGREKEMLGWGNSPWAGISAPFLGSFCKPIPGTLCSGDGEQVPQSARTIPSNLSLLGIFHTGVIARTVLLHTFKVRHADVCPVAPDGHQIC